MQGFQTALTRQILGEQRRWCCYLCRKQDTHCGGIAKSKATLRRRCLENGAQWRSGRWGVQKGRSLWESTVIETLLCPLLWTLMTWALNNKCLGLTARFLFFFLFFPFGRDNIWTEKSALSKKLGQAVNLISKVVCRLVLWVFQSQESVTHGWTTLGRRRGQTSFQAMCSAGAVIPGGATWKDVMWEELGSLNLALLDHEASAFLPGLRLLNLIL